MAKKTIIGEDGKEYTVKEKRPIYKRVWFWVLAIIVIAGIGSQLGDEKTPIASEKKTPTETVEKAVKEPLVTEQITETEPVVTEAPIPTEHANALKKGESYATTMSMSKQGVYNQLTSEFGENFPPEAAQYAVDELDKTIDWNANALKKAKSYFETMAMSKDKVYEQLISEFGEKFTPEQAQYAVDNLE